MAILLSDALLGQLSGKLGQLVIKQYKNRTVITVLPEKKKRAQRKPSELKKLSENNFAAGVKYAQGIIRDPKLKKAYEKKLQPGQSVYNYAISEYYRIKASDAKKGKGAKKK